MSSMAMEAKRAGSPSNSQARAGLGRRLRSLLSFTSHFCDVLSVCSTKMFLKVEEQ